MAGQLMMRLMVVLVMTIYQVVPAMMRSMVVRVWTLLVVVLGKMIWMVVLAMMF